MEVGSSWFYQSLESIDVTDVETFFLLNEGFEYLTIFQMGPQGSHVQCHARVTPKVQLKLETGDLL